MTAYNMRRALSTLFSFVILINSNGITAEKDLDGNAVVHQATLYSDRDSQGKSITLTDNTKDIKGKGFEEKALSACFTGVWVFFDETEFEPGWSQYVFAPKRFCLNFENTGGAIQSARYVGLQKDSRVDTITLYEENYFQGEQMIVTGDSPKLANLSNHISSFIITGEEPWTAYDQPDYAGNQLCLLVHPSDNFMPTFEPDVTSLNMTLTSIKSLKMGAEGKCEMKSMLRKKKPPFEHLFIYEKGRSAGGKRKAKTIKV